MEKCLAVMLMWNFPHSRVAQKWRGQWDFDVAHALLGGQLVLYCPQWSQECLVWPGSSLHLWSCSAGMKEESLSLEREMDPGWGTHILLAQLSTFMGTLERRGSAETFKRRTLLE